MGILDKIKGEFIDVIEWLDSSENTLAHRYERYQNEIKTGSKLTVREGQIAVFINEGKIGDKFGPGYYTLTTENLPILTTLNSWKYGFNSPFKAEVYFLSSKNITSQKWGTKNPIIVSDSRFGMLEIRAFGTFAMRINFENSGTFIKEIVGTSGHFTTENITEQLRSLIVTHFTQAVAESGFPIEGFAARLNIISEYVFEIIKPEFHKYGIELNKFLIENISMPDEIKKEIFDLSRLNVIDLNKLMQLKTAKAIELAAMNENGNANNGIGLGIGFALANKMSQTFESKLENNEAKNELNYFVIINGKQEGPLSLNTIKQMYSSNLITPDTLFWQEGMTKWLPAIDLTDLKNIFTTIPPPIP